MNKDVSKQPVTLDKRFYRIAYAAFVVLSLYFLLVNKDLSSAVGNFGIALVFDPFDQKVTWNKRPLYQRAWLLVHLILLFTGFGFMIAGAWH